MRVLLDTVNEDAYYAIRSLKASMSKTLVGDDDPEPEWLTSEWVSRTLRRLGWSWSDGSVYARMYRELVFSCGLAGPILSGCWTEFRQVYQVSFGDVQRYGKPCSPAVAPRNLA